VLRIDGRIVWAAAMLALALGIASCGLGKRPAGTTVALTVTRDFGRRTLAATTEARPPSSATAITVLERAFAVRRGADGSVRAIRGVTAGSGTEWFEYVNGVQYSGATAPGSVSPGDSVWWDLHDRRAAGSVPAVVGSFPEPFLRGIGGKRLPVTLVCAADVQRACRRVASALTAAGVPVALQGLGTGSGPDTLAIVVGVWNDLVGQIDAALVQRGPSASGVYARFVRGDGAGTAGGAGTGAAGTGAAGSGGAAGPAGAAGAPGTTLELLDAHGRVVRTLGARAGLVAATRDNVSEPTWLVTGTDRAGVEAAARALTPARLRDRFAVAVDRGRDLPLPLK
jgi:hypothetical protein